MALGEGDHGVARGVHRLELLLLGESRAIVAPVYACARSGNPGLAAQHALAIDRAVEGGVAGGALLHELGEHARAVHLFPIFRDFLERPVAHAPAAPVRYDLLAVDRQVGSAETV